MLRNWARDADPLTPEKEAGDRNSILLGPEFQSNFLNVVLKSYLTNSQGSCDVLLEKIVVTVDQSWRANSVLCLLHLPSGKLN